MKLLVTGGAGYIGSTVATLLLEAGHQVVVLDDLSTGYADAVPAGATFVPGRVQDLAGEILTPGAGFDGVVHLAAFISVAESVRHPDRYWDNNVVATLRLLDAMRAAGVPRLIFSSTGTVHGDTEDLPVTERSPLQPLNPYAASKLAVDLMLAGEAAGHGLGAVSLRYFNAAGAYGACGERHDPETHLIPIVLQVARGEQEKLPLYGDDYPTPDGTCIRDYIHVADLGTAHLLALDAVRPGQHTIYNLGNGNGYSNKQVVDVVREVTGRPVPVEMAPRRPGDIVAQVASSAKAHAELGWQPTRPSLHEIVADAWAF
ncbi:MAG TPA: UDP-glucose 4-epimerase GalE, partial [Micromonosporaceae bacterium]